MDSYISIKLGVNLLDSFWENGFYVLMIHKDSKIRKIRNALNDLKWPWTVTFFLYILNTYPHGPDFSPFC